MDTEDLLRNLVFEYWGIVAANEGWDCSLYEFLISRGIDEETARETALSAT